MTEIRDSAGGVYRPPHGIGPPSADERLGFLRILQRVLKEGDFTATYKFALLQSLMDVAVESQVRDKSELHVTYWQLADKFIEYYWGHAQPYRPGAHGGGVLRQSPGRQAAVITAIADARGAKGASTLSQFRRGSKYQRLRTIVAGVIRSQPAKYIQNLNGGRVEFLFYGAPGGKSIVLKPGVAWCLQEFYDLIQGQLRACWVERVRSISGNASLIGGHRDLEEFLFGQERAALNEVRERLLDLDGDCCFYCERPVKGEITVDHFVPWTLYPHDRGHNFVLAHSACNSSKRDSLAGRGFLERWLYRLDHQAVPIAAALSDLMLCDAEGSRRVAQWAYLRELDCGGMFWEGVQDKKPVYHRGDHAMRGLFGDVAFA